MRTVCIYRKGASTRWKGKDVKWIVCAKCRQESADHQLVSLERFFNEEIERMTREMSPRNTEKYRRSSSPYPTNPRHSLVGASPMPHASEQEQRHKLHTQKESGAPNRPHKIVGKKVLHLTDYRRE